MGAAYSPHRDVGGILHFPSPSHIHHVDPASALRQLRRSLSRSPSKGPTFRLVTSKSTSPLPASPLSPSPLSPHRGAGLTALTSNVNVTSPSPMAIPFPPSAKKGRASMRKLSPMRSASRSSSGQRNPIKRGLSDSTDNGNANPSSPLGAGVGIENRPSRSLSPEAKILYESSSNTGDTGVSDSLLAPHHAFPRFERENRFPTDFAAKSSPLKRSDGIMNLDQASLGSPSAKRRSLHGASFGPDFNIFDHEALASAHAQYEICSNGDRLMPDGPSVLEQSNAFSPLPRRTSSLRKTTLQQRHEKPSFARSKPNGDLAQELSTPGPVASKGRSRMSLETFLPPNSRDSPFASQGSLPNASMHPILHQRKEPQGTSSQAPLQRHPLSRTMTQSSSSSSLAEDSPTHIPLRQPEPRRPFLNFSKSLPVGGVRPDLREPISHESSSHTSSTEASFATPENYKLAKPLPAAFMSTGLISKRNKNMDISHSDFNSSTTNMPDTPCKRSNNLLEMSPGPIQNNVVGKARHNRHSVHSFGTPSTPFNPHAARPASGTFGKGASIFGSGFTGDSFTRRGSFVSIEGDDIPQSSSGKREIQPSIDFDLSPTPSKQSAGGSFGRSSQKFCAGGGMCSSPNRDPSGAFGTEPTQFGQSCKSIPERVQGGSPSKDSGSDVEDSPVAVLRFKSFSAISSYSTRSRLFRHSHSPTPLSKKSLTIPYHRVRNMKTKSSPLSPASPLREHFGQMSPHTPQTPQESILPPDPSGLSISAHGDVHLNQSMHSVSSSASVYAPATPTTSRDYFPQFGKRSSTTPVHNFIPIEIDPTLTSRFDKVEMIGTGEFSQVYRVAQKSNVTAELGHSITSNPRNSQKSSTQDQVWAVKRSRNKYIGPKDRSRKLQEVEVLKMLGRSDHTVQLFDSWEHQDHLYIQTEFCEEGSLDIFLEQAGRKARLDDFRIWKILLELSLVSSLLKPVTHSLTNATLRDSNTFMIVVSCI